MKKKIVDLLFLLLILYVFKTWFFLNPLSSGDWSFNFEESIKTFTLFPYSWNFNLNAGLGGASLFILALSSFFLFTASFLFNIFKLPWVLIERLVWFWPFLVISVFTSYYLFKKLFSNEFALLSSFIYLFNTYILMIVGGGQMGIALAYSIAPIVLASFIKFTDVILSSSRNIKYQISNIKYAIIAGLLLSVLVFFDLRVAYISMIAVMLYFVLSIKYKVSKKNILNAFFLILYTLFIPIGIASLLHSFWLFPLLVYHQNPISQLGSAYSTEGAVRFFSFAKFENAISLFHSNWPENIFGKVGFLKPEFLLLPILAYSSLFFVTSSKVKGQKSKLQLETQNFKNNLTIEQSNDKIIIFFALLALLGAFLAKGANEPFGGIYLWLFNNFPGFIMFRDPTKFYILIVLSYSVLIPFSVWKIYESIESKIKNQKSKLQLKIQKFIPSIFLFVIVFCLLYLIRPAVLGQLSGTFKTVAVPNDYIKLEEFISKDKSFYRTLWVPTIQRFGYYSNSHPAIPAQNFYKTVDYSQIFKSLGMPESQKILQELSVRYVIVPYDSEGEIFLNDRRYDEKQYKKALSLLRKIKWLKEKDFGKIALFEVQNPKAHFFSSSNMTIKYNFINPTEYKVYVENAKRGDRLIFSEGFDKNWEAENSEFRIQSSEFDNKLNSFILSKNGNYSLLIYYKPQKWVNFGLWVSGVSLLTVLIFISFGYRLKK